MKDLIIPFYPIGYIYRPVLMKPEEKIIINILCIHSGSILLCCVLSFNQPYCIKPILPNRLNITIRKFHLNRVFYAELLR